ncbi:glycosyltransferase family 2 protein [Ekhidna sp. To15]|uniref:glycosyltransferase family 2 protein n=1 Tax=Ekhidna sp. To15 TaxID=3395267 RepID=UPI003F52598F
MISVIIPAYNAVNFLKQTVKSVINQTYKDWELIIVNDGSKDGTLGLSNELASEDTRIRVVDQQNGGVSSARNTGIKDAKGKYLSFLDADDCWHENFLIRCFEKLDGSHLGLVYSDLLIIDEKGNRTGEIKKGKEGWLLDDLLAWKEHIISPPSGILVKRELIETIGAFDEQLSNNADQDFYIRSAAEFEIGKVEEPMLLYRIHSNNMHGNIKVMETDTIKVFKKAKESQLFKSERFMKSCFSNMYLILAKSYLGHEKNIGKFVVFAFKSFINSPQIFFKRLMKR